MNSILHAFQIDATGKATPIPMEQLPHLKVEEGYIWLHFNGNAPETRKWFEDDVEVDRLATRVLLAADARPRTIAHEENLLINLRGVNLNPGSEPEDMIGIRFFVQPRRVISVERRGLKATIDMVEQLKSQSVSVTPGGFLATFALSLAARMSPTITDINEQVDELEEKVDNDQTDNSRENLSDIRREAIMLRRYLAPQRDALNTLSLQNLSWIAEDDKLRIRDAADQAARVTEELDAIRERCAIVKDQLADQRAEEMNRNMMILSVVAAIFLPLGLISGMMGINVGGMPWVENVAGFWYVTAIVLVVGFIQLIVFRILKWI